ncbi:MAG: FAD-dependent oxidoreductase [Spirochaetota bacterium]
MKTMDVLVVGAGPAGLSAAIEARRYGAKVLLADEQDMPGGQLFKQIHKFFGSKKHWAGKRGYAIGMELFNEAQSMGVEILLKTKVLGIFKDHFVSWIVDDRSMSGLKARCIVLATGGIEKAFTFPGWTLPGVITAGAAQTFCNIERVLPGKRVLMIGSGNVGLIVSFQLLQAGAEVAAVVEAAPSISGYLVHASKIRRAGVPIFTGQTIKEARGSTKIEEVVLRSVDGVHRHRAGTQKSFTVDTICLSVGLSPDTRLARMAGLSMYYAPQLGGFLPVHDRTMKSSVEGIYIAGDLAGIEEANTALDEGRLAGTCAAESLGFGDTNLFQHVRSELWQRLDGLRRGPFGHDRFICKQDIILTGSPERIPKDKRISNHPESEGKLKNVNGVPSLVDLQHLPGYPSPARIKRGAVACIECAEEIPCDPCVEACSFGAISIGPNITDLPRLAEDKCRGCGLCITACPGQVIFLMDYTFSEDKASLSLPYEFLPYPKTGERVWGVNRRGEPVATAEVLRVQTREDFDKTAIVTIAFDKKYIHHVRSFTKR